MDVEPSSNRSALGKNSIRLRAKSPRGKRSIRVSRSLAAAADGDGFQNGGRSHDDRRKNRSGARIRRSISSALCAPGDSITLCRGSSSRSRSRVGSGRQAAGVTTADAAFRTTSTNTTPQRRSDGQFSASRARTSSKEKKSCFSIPGLSRGTSA